MSNRITVDDLVTQVRQQLAEENRDSISDVNDILPALNRGQDYGADVLVRHYPEPLLTHDQVDLVAGQQEYDIPAAAFEQRIEKIEVVINGLMYPIERIDYKDVSMYETAQTKSAPLYWCVVGDKYRFLPNVLATYPIRVWYMKDPLKLVPSQGRINILNITDNYIIVDSVGSDLSTESDQLASYINIVDGANGDVKATMQIQNIQGNKVTFKTIPIRAEVIGITLDTAIPTTVTEDDNICLVQGTCVPFMKKPMSNFLVQYAVAELRRKFGEADTNLEEQVLKQFEDQIMHQWAGRTNAYRVQGRSNNWPIYNTRRLVITQG